MQFRGRMRRSSGAFRMSYVVLRIADCGLRISYVGFRRVNCGGNLEFWMKGEKNFLQREKKLGSAEGWPG